MTALPSIPAKRYFTIGEVALLCGVKPHVLRYWEQEFTQLRPMKRRGNRRYYQHHEVLMIRRIRELLYDQGFTITGARNRLQESGHAASSVNGPQWDDNAPEAVNDFSVQASDSAVESAQGWFTDSNAVRKELFEIRALLSW
ncbi:MAG: MerR family transcriptional regulator [Burkholderiaceae bacterium]|nr:MerR family transcriptional regulator [Burkholderiaceae bacterium]